MLVIAGIDFEAPAEQLAQQLIGTTFLVEGVGGMIVETEAYDQNDPASHSFNGQTARNANMFREAGLLGYSDYLVDCNNIFQKYVASQYSQNLF